MFNSSKASLRHLFPWVLALSSSPMLWPAEAYNTVARRVTGKIQVDGVLAEAAWQESPTIADFTQVEPRSGNPPTEVTEVWVAYTRDALYIAARCHDRNPRQIVATEMRRDAALGENDRIEIVLDTYHDHRNAYYFATNAAGALVDGRVTENQEPGLEWDGMWMVRSRIDGEGWSAEF